MNWAANMDHSQTSSIADGLDGRTPTERFPADYTQSRSAFAEACAQAELVATSYPHPLPGPRGLPLAADVVRVGPDDASRLLVLTSGVHGPELMAGSACQSFWLRSAAAAGGHGRADEHRLPPDTAVLLVHAINPWGAAQLRRNNEDNVDLCRNWVDFGAQRPSHAAYELLHGAVIANPADAKATALADETLSQYSRSHGGPALYGALMAGQYMHADGLGFGGFGPTWSRQTMEQVLRSHARGARQVCMVDYHTGVGPYGYGSIVALQTGASLARARRAFGAWVIAPNEADRPADFVPVTGHTTPGYEHLLSGAEVTAVVLEFGTHAAAQMLELLLLDHRLTVSGADAAATREQLLRFFLPQDAWWREAVVQRSDQVIRQALRFLEGQT